MAVAVVPVLPIADEIRGDGGAAPELLVRGPDAGVDDVGVHTRPRVVIGVGAVERAVALVDAV